MLVEIPYGSESLRLDIEKKNLVQVLRPNRVAGRGEKEIANALKNPTGTGRLREIAKQGEKVAIIIDDNTRLTPANLILPQVLKELRAAGVDDILIVIALGTHRPMSRGEIRDKVGSVNVSVINHDCDDTAYCGKTENWEVWLNEEVCEADVRICIGNIIPHCIVGWSGGAKIMLPGVAGRKSIEGFHFEFARNARNTLGSVETPLRKKMESFVRHIGLQFIVNAVLNGEGEIVKIVAGDFVKAHRFGVDAARKVFEVEAAAKSDIIIASSFPADLEFWQAAKAVFSGEIITKDDGTLVLLAPCKEGVGRTHTSFAEQIGARMKLSDVAEQKDVISASTAYRIGKVRDKINISLVSEGISEKEAGKMGFEYFDSTEDALRDAYRKHGKNAKVSVITHGGEIFPKI
jgi:nickel-dependent lactate racemase